jgi:[ribosomal protein S18]-alanine N-acetyltransferase
MESLTIIQAGQKEKEWTALLLSASDPWLTLGISFDQCLKVCNDPEYIVFTAYLSEEPCGAVIIDPRGFAGSAYIKSIAVSPEFRNRNIGAALLSYAGDYCRKTSKWLALCVSSFNRKAEKFYMRNGFHKAGELDNYLIEGASEIIMIKKL